MFSRKRFLAGASAVALAAGTTLAGAGIASAQDDGTGSLDIGSIDIVSIGASLQTASEALNGPVSVAANAEGGPTVTYANETEGDQRCVGFTAPYSTVVEDDIDTNYDSEDIVAAIALLQALEGGGDVSLLDVDDDGAPIAYEDPDPDSDNNVVALFLPVLAHDSEDPEAGDPGVVVNAGDEIAWTAPTPGTPAITVVACVPEAGGDLATYTGIDPQVVADQMNDIFPGGSLDAGSVNGGSVELGADLLTPFATASSVLGNDGDDD